MDPHPIDRMAPVDERETSGILPITDATDLHDQGAEGLRHRPLADFRGDRQASWAHPRLLPHRGALARHPLRRLPARIPSLLTAGFPCGFGVMIRTAEVWMRRRMTVHNSFTRWPELDWNRWRDTAETLHMLLQIVGKTRLALTPVQNHWWNVPLYLTARGLSTSPML